MNEKRALRPEPYQESASIRRLAPIGDSNGGVRITTESGLKRLNLVLAASTLEVIPLRDVEAQFAYLDPGQRVSVTASPSQGQDATIDVAVDLAEAGFEVVPHLSARLIRDETHLREIASRLWGAQISRAFVVGGDGDDAGTFPDAAALLMALRSLDHGPTEIGIAGYPEGHPQIPNTRLMASLLEKQAFADYVTTQMCFDAAATTAWIRRIRHNGVTLPVDIGIPGVTSLSRLLSVSAKIGVGASVRFLSKHAGITGLVRRGTYTPDRLVAELIPAIEDPMADVRGFHIYTFNQVDTTQRWRTGYTPDPRPERDEARRETRA